MVRGPARQRLQQHLEALHLAAERPSLREVAKTTRERPIKIKNTPHSTIGNLLDPEFKGLTQWENVHAFVDACLHLRRAGAVLDPNYLEIEWWRELHDAARVEWEGDQAARLKGVQLLGPVPERANAFQMRGEVAVLEEALVAGGTAVVAPAAQVLSGMFGVGKTQLAADYALRSLDRRSVDLLLWITATQREDIIAAYSDAIATALDGVPGGTSEQNADRFLSWLRTTSKRWLIVLDDLATPNDLTGLWPPSTASGKTIVTTRWRDPVLDGDVRELVCIGPFTSAEAEGYLTRAFRKRPRLADDVHGVAEALGRLPLALSHAYAYMATQGVPCSGYLRLLANRGIPISDLVADEVAIPDDYARTIDATWSICLDAADRLNPAGLARPLLELASVLDPNGMPEDVFTNGSARRWLSQRLGGQEISELNARKGLRCLRRLNLIAIDDRDDADEDTAVVRVHALVQQVTRDHLGQRENEVLVAAAGAVEEVCAVDHRADRKMLALLMKTANAAGGGDRLTRAFNRLLDMIDRKYDYAAMAQAWEATYALQATIEIALPLVLDCLNGTKADRVETAETPTASRVGVTSYVTQEAASTLSSAFTSIDDWRAAQPQRAIEILECGLHKWELRKRFVEALAVYKHPDALAAVLGFAAEELDGEADLVALDAVAVALGSLGKALDEPERDAAVAMLSRIAELHGPRRKTVRSAIAARAELTGIPEADDSIGEAEIAVYLSPTSERGQYSDWADAQWYAEYVERKLAPQGMSAELGEVLLRAFQHRHQVVRVAVARCLGHLNDPRARTALEAELRGHVPADLRQACSEALAMHDVRR